MVNGISDQNYAVKECEELKGKVNFGDKNPSGDHNCKCSHRLDNQRNPITMIGRVVWTAA